MSPTSYQTAPPRTHILAHRTLPVKLPLPSAGYNNDVPRFLVPAAASRWPLPCPPKLRFFPLKDIRPGMHGIGRTVFSGNRIEEFQVEILGVLENIGPKESIILARLSGGPLEETGVMQGMSGSPVYIDGKLAGAVALAFPFSKEPIAGIRPIEDMVRPAATRAAHPPRRALAHRARRPTISRASPRPTRSPWPAARKWSTSPRRSPSADSRAPPSTPSRRNSAPWAWNRARASVPPGKLEPAMGNPADAQARLHDQRPAAVRRL